MQLLYELLIQPCYYTSRVQHLTGRMVLSDQPLAQGWIREELMSSFQYVHVIGVL